MSCSPQRSMWWSWPGAMSPQKNFQLQPKYRDTRQIKVTVCNEPVQLNSDVLVAYMSAYGSGKEWWRCPWQMGRHTVTSSWTSALIGRASRPSHTYWPIGTSRWWWSRRARSNSTGLANSLVTKACLHKSAIINNNNINNSRNINPGKTICPTTNPTMEPKGHPNNSEEGWIQVTRKGKNRPIKQQNQRQKNNKKKKSN